MARGNTRVLKILRAAEENSGLVPTRQRQITAMMQEPEAVDGTVAVLAIPIRQPAMSTIQEEALDLSTQRPMPDIGQADIQDYKWTAEVQLPGIAVIRTRQAEQRQGIPVMDMPE